VHEEASHVVLASCVVAAIGRADASTEKIPDYFKPRGDGLAVIRSAERATSLGGRMTLCVFTLAPAVAFWRLLWRGWRSPVDEGVADQLDLSLALGPIRWQVRNAREGAPCA